MSAAVDPVHPRHQLTDILSHPVRFSILAALAQTEELEFSVLRDHLQVSDSVLSKQLSALEQAGLIKIRKGFVGKRPRTWLRTTTQGRAAWTRHLDALRRIAAGD